MVKKPLSTFLVLQGIIWAVAIAIFPQSMHEGSIRLAKTNPSEYALDTITLQSEESGNDLFTNDDIDTLRKKFSKAMSCRFDACPSPKR